MKLIVKDRRIEWKIGVLRKDLTPREFALTLLETSAVESGGSVRNFKRNQQPLFRGESPSFVDFPLSRYVDKLASPHYS